MQPQSIKRSLGVPGMLATLLVVAGCSMAPAYQVPEVTDKGTPTAFKEAALPANQAGTWKTAEPSEATERGEWWKVFGDPTLDKLEADALAANQSLKAAAARVQEARGVQRQARAALFPTLDASFGPTRQKVSPASQLQPDGTNIAPYTLWRAQAGVGYEVDLFGRVSDSVAAARADAEQSEALYRSVQLALQADVAQNYFNLRQLDAEQALYTQTVKLREEALKLVQRRFTEGDIGELDVARAKAELATAQSDALAIARLRAASEHSLAILLGKTPAEFTFEPAPLAPVNVRIPAGLPSALLERRPDIAAAERAMAAANARIGVAKAAFFPSISLTGSGGFEAATLGDLFNWSSRTFLLGPAVGGLLSLPIFDGGARSGNLVRARAQYEEDVANYRQQVLVAFREVEDNLSNLRLLDEQTRAQDDAVRSSRRAAQLSRTQYQEGSIAYLDVIDAERTVLQAQRNAVQLAGAQAVSTVNLIRALGGGWGDVPAAKPNGAPTASANAANPTVAAR
ncbi:efflux transporter outer membrane subunit [Pandoraea sp. CB10b_02]|uniref:efflux transporter outer membrane subunit n=1 Tax=Pandoraea sp. CB10b_02 TaxID=2014535 RepID=UPI00258090DB|nr:efflux transporter outer membrane subunit [Pandoraea sp. CB10b_02]